jgi:hypothetical protein
MESKGNQLLFDAIVDMMSSLFSPQRFATLVGRNEKNCVLKHQQCCMREKERVNERIKMLPREGEGVNRRYKIITIWA